MICKFTFKYRFQLMLSDVFVKIAYVSAWPKKPPESTMPPHIGRLWVMA